MVRPQFTATGALALLSEPDVVFKQHALKALNPLVPQFWAEISEHIASMSVCKACHLCPLLTNFFNRREALYESSDLSKEARDLAALLASKVYYFLGESDEALSFALGAGNAFEAEARTPGSEEYIETVVCKLHSMSCARPRFEETPFLSQGH
jgi:26S proteasome regulatory subunit N2